MDEIIRASADGGTWSWTFWVNNNNNNVGKVSSFDPGYQSAPNASRFADMKKNGLMITSASTPRATFWASTEEVTLQYLSPQVFYDFALIFSHCPMLTKCLRLVAYRVFGLMATLLTLFIWLT